MRVFDSSGKRLPNVKCCVKCGGDEDIKNLKYAYPSVGMEGLHCGICLKKFGSEEVIIEE